MPKGKNKQSKTPKAQRTPYGVGGVKKTSAEVKLSQTKKPKPVAAQTETDRKTTALPRVKQKPVTPHAAGGVEKNPTALKLPQVARPKTAASPTKTHTKTPALPPIEQKSVTPVEHISSITPTKSKTSVKDTPKGKLKKRIASSPKRKILNGVIEAADSTKPRKLKRMTDEALEEHLKKIIAETKKNDLIDELKQIGISLKPLEVNKILLENLLNDLVSTIENHDPPINFEDRERIINDLNSKWEDIIDRHAVSGHKIETLATHLRLHKIYKHADATYLQQAIESIGLIEKTGKFTYDHQAQAREVIKLIVDDTDFPGVKALREILLKKANAQNINDPKLIEYLTKHFENAGAYDRCINAIKCLKKKTLDDKLQGLREIGLSNPEVEVISTLCVGRPYIITFPDGYEEKKGDIETEHAIATRSRQLIASADKLASELGITRNSIFPEFKKIKPGDLLYGRMMTEIRRLTDIDALDTDQQSYHDRYHGEGKTQIDERKNWIEEIKESRLYDKPEIALGENATHFWCYDVVAAKVRGQNSKLEAQFVEIKSAETRDDVITALKKVGIFVSEKKGFFANRDAQIINRILCENLLRKYLDLVMTKSPEDDRRIIAAYLNANWETIIDNISGRYRMHESHHIPVKLGEHKSKSAVSHEEIEKSKQQIEEIRAHLAVDNPNIEGIFKLLSRHSLRPEKPKEQVQIGTVNQDPPIHDIDKIKEAIDKNIDTFIKHTFGDVSKLKEDFQGRIRSAREDFIKKLSEHGPTHTILMAIGHTLTGDNPEEEKIVKNNPANAIAAAFKENIGTIVKDIRIKEAHDAKIEADRIAKEQNAREAKERAEREAMERARLAEENARAAREKAEREAKEKARLAKEQAERDKAALEAKQAALKLAREQYDSSIAKLNTNRKKAELLIAAATKILKEHKEYANTDKGVQLAGAIAQLESTKDKPHASPAHEQDPKNINALNSIIQQLNNDLNSQIASVTTMKDALEKAINKSLVRQEIYDFFKKYYITEPYEKRGDKSTTNHGSFRHFQEALKDKDFAQLFVALKDEKDSDSVRDKLNEALGVKLTLGKSTPESKEMHRKDTFNGLLADAWFRICDKYNKVMERSDIEAALSELTRKEQVARAMENVKLRASIETFLNKIADIKQHPSATEEDKKQIAALRHRTIDAIMDAIDKIPDIAKVEEIRLLLDNKTTLKSFTITESTLDVIRPLIVEYITQLEAIKAKRDQAIEAAFNTNLFKAVIQQLEPTYHTTEEDKNELRKLIGDHHPYLKYALNIENSNDIAAFIINQLMRAKTVEEAKLSAGTMSKAEIQTTQSDSCANEFFNSAIAKKIRPPKREISDEELIKRICDYFWNHRQLIDKLELNLSYPTAKSITEKDLAAFYHQLSQPSKRDTVPEIILSANASFRNITRSEAETLASDWENGAGKHATGADSQIFVKAVAAYRERLVSIEAKERSEQERLKGLLESAKENLRKEIQKSEAILETAKTAVSAINNDLAALAKLLNVQKTVTTIPTMTTLSALIHQGQTALSSPIATIETIANITELTNKLNSTSQLVMSDTKQARSDFDKYRIEKMLPELENLERQLAAAINAATEPMEKATQLSSQKEHEKDQAVSTARSAISQAQEELKKAIQSISPVKLDVESKKDASQISNRITALKEFTQPVIDCTRALTNALTTYDAAIKKAAEKARIQEQEKTQAIEAQIQEQARRDQSAYQAAIANLDKTKAQSQPLLEKAANIKSEAEKYSVALPSIETPTLDQALKNAMNTAIPLFDPKKAKECIQRIKQIDSKINEEQRSLAANLDQLERMITEIEKAKAAEAKAQSELKPSVDAANILYQSIKEIERRLKDDPPSQAHFTGVISQASALRALIDSVKPLSVDTAALQRIKANTSANTALKQQLSDSTAALNKNLEEALRKSLEAAMRAHEEATKLATTPQADADKLIAEAKALKIVSDPTKLQNLVASIKEAEALLKSPPKKDPISIQDHTKAINTSNAKIIAAAQALADQNTELQSTITATKHSRELEQKAAAAALKELKESCTIAEKAYNRFLIATDSDPEAKNETSKTLEELLKQANTIIDAGKFSSLPAVNELAKKIRENTTALVEISNAHRQLNEAVAAFKDANKKSFELLQSYHKLKGDPLFEKLSHPDLTTALGDLSSTPPPTRNLGTAKDILATAQEYDKYTKHILGQNAQHEKDIQALKERMTCIDEEDRALAILKNTLEWADKTGLLKQTKLVLKNADAIKGMQPYDLYEIRAIASSISRYAALKSSAKDATIDSIRVNIKACLDAAESISKLETLLAKLPPELTQGPKIPDDISALRREEAAQLIQFDQAVDEAKDLERQANTIFTHARSLLKTSTATTDPLSELLDNAESDLAEMKKQLDAHNSPAIEHSSKDTIKNNINKIKSDTDLLRSSMGQLSNSINQLLERMLTKVQNTLQASIDTATKLITDGHTLPPELKNKHTAFVMAYSRIDDSMKLLTPLPADATRLQVTERIHALTSLTADLDRAISAFQTALSNFKKPKETKEIKPPVDIITPHVDTRKPEPMLKIHCDDLNKIKTRFFAHGFNNDDYNLLKLIISSINELIKASQTKPEMLTELTKLSEFADNLSKDMLNISSIKSRVYESGKKVLPAFTKHTEVFSFTGDPLAAAREKLKLPEPPKDTSALSLTASPTEQKLWTENIDQSHARINTLEGKAANSKLGVYVEHVDPVSHAFSSDLLLIDDALKVETIFKDALLTKLDKSVALDKAKIQDFCDALATYLQVNSKDPKSANDIKEFLKSPEGIKLMPLSAVDQDKMADTLSTHYRTRVSEPDYKDAISAISFATANSLIAICPTDKPIVINDAFSPEIAKEVAKVLTLRGVAYEDETGYEIMKQPPTAAEVQALSDHVDDIAKKGDIHNPLYKVMHTLLPSKLQPPANKTELMPQVVLPTFFAQKDLDKNLNAVKQEAERVRGTAKHK